MSEKDPKDYPVRPRVMHGAGKLMQQARDLKGLSPAAEQVHKMNHAAQMVQQQFEELRARTELAEFRIATAVAVVDAFYKQTKALDAQDPMRLIADPILEYVSLALVKTPQ